MRAVAIAFLCLVAALAPAAANHPQTSDGHTLIFDHKTGNEWWVELILGGAGASQATRVESRDDGGAWVPLTKRSWGAWAASYHIEVGHRVYFRVFFPDAASIESCAFSHPSGVEQCGPVVWPREGSFVTYYAERGLSAPNGYAQWSETNVTFRYGQGAWRSSCEGWAYERSPVDGSVSRERILADGTLAPPRGPASVAVSSLAVFDFIEVCGYAGRDYIQATVTRQTTVTTTRGGASVQSPAWEAEFHPANPEDVAGWWHTGTGLVLSWSRSASGGYHLGHLEDTDAPIAVGDPVPTPPSRASWPFEGSFARYEDHGESKPGAYPYAFDGRLDLGYRLGYWQGLCGFREGNASLYVHVVWSPAAARTPVTAGDDVLVPVIGGCQRGFLGVDVTGVQTETTGRNGALVTTSAYRGDETAEQGASNDYRDAFWDTDTGLVLRWATDTPPSRTSGKLWDTDAPLG